MISYVIPDSLAAEINDLETLIAARKAGTASDIQLKAHRVPFGVYEQRVRGAYMVRVRTTGGIVSPSQLAAVSDIAAVHGSGVIHITTRQELQIHDIPLDNIIPVIRALVPYGLSSRGGGGNTVRNIMASWDAGISRDEVFDVTPYVVALTTRLISETDSWILPRKFKISFSGSAADNALATVNDLGFVASLRDGRKGFRVYVAGGMGRQPQPGRVLHEWIDADEVCAVTEAVKRVFDKYGNRKNRHSARLRFLWNNLGSERFIELYRHERDALAATGITTLDLPDVENRTAVSSRTVLSSNKSAGFALWRSRHVRPQRQTGLWSVTIPVFLGVIDAKTLAVVAEFTGPFGDAAIRLTSQQNMSLRNIPEEHLPGLYQRLRALLPLADQPAVNGAAIACAGAATCQLGLCRSRDALSAVTGHLATVGFDLDRVAGVRIHISGCPNTCGQHMIADLGFFGKTGFSDGHAYPVYGIVAGAVVGDGVTRLARRLGEIPARALPVFVERVLSAFAGSRGKDRTFSDFIDTEGADVVRKTGEELCGIPSFDKTPAFFRDWGSDLPFSTEGRGTGECAAGLFDMIDVDRSRTAQLRPAAIAGDGTAIRAIVVSAAHTLLVAKGVTAADDAQTLDTFEREFIDDGLIDARFAPLLAEARANPSGMAPSRATDAMSLADAVDALYESMDESLRLVKPTMPATPVPDSEKDLRGVACPMNFVKTKMALAGLAAGQTLAVLLDDGKPIANVPGSVEQEGHRIVDKQRQGDAWRILIEKGR